MTKKILLFVWVLVLCSGCSKYGKNGETGGGPANIISRSNLAVVLENQQQLFYQTYDDAGLPSEKLTPAPELKDINGTTQSVQNVVVRSLSQGEQLAFVIAGDKQVYTLAFHNGIPEMQYRLVSAGQVKALTTAIMANGNQLLFVIGLDDQVYTSTVDIKMGKASPYELLAVGC
ncbi:MAG: hypothetical protein ACKN9V_07005, partial [Pseudomonadota bacterium]